MKLTLEAEREGAFALTDGEYGVSITRPEAASDGWVEGFTVEIREPGLSATAKVEVSRYVDTPATLFRELSENWSGWTGEKSWRSMEGELELVATSDRLGHISLCIRLTPSVCSDTWAVTTYVGLEAGQLNSLYARARSFFRVKA